MKYPILILCLLAAGCKAPAQSAPSGAPLNGTCPRSGEPVVESSLTTYRGHVVGFCNTHCRDDFAAHVDERPDDRAFFDELIAAHE